MFKGLGGGNGDCTDSQRSKYYAKISGPLLDRIDIQVEVPAVKFADIVMKAEAESSSAIKARVMAARHRQRERFAGTMIFVNVQMGPREIREFCRIGPKGEKLLEAAVAKLGFSARAYDRSLKVAEARVATGPARPPSSVLDSSRTLIYPCSRGQDGFSKQKSDSL